MSVFNVFRRGRFVQMRVTKCSDCKCVFTWFMSVRNDVCFQLDPLFDSTLQTWLSALFGLIVRKQWKYFFYSLSFSFCLLISKKICPYRRCHHAGGDNSRRVTSEWRSPRFEDYWNIFMLLFISREFRMSQLTQFNQCEIVKFKNIGREHERHLSSTSGTNFQFFQLVRVLTTVQNEQFNKHPIIYFQLDALTGPFECREPISKNCRYKFVIFLKIEQHRVTSSLQRHHEMRNDINKLAVNCSHKTFPIRLVDSRRRCISDH